MVELIKLINLPLSQLINLVDKYFFVHLIDTISLVKTCMILFKVSQK